MFTEHPACTCYARQMDNVLEFGAPAAKNYLKNDGWRGRERERKRERERERERERQRERK